MRCLLLVLLAASMSVPWPQDVFTALRHRGSGASATPGFVSESGKNSLLTIALGTSGGSGQIPSSLCASYSYCLPFAETSLSGNLAIVPFEYANGGTAVTATNTDDKSDSYTCTSPAATDSNKLLGLCFAPNLTSGAHLVSTTYGTTAVTQVNEDAAMFYNVATSSPLDGSVSAVAGVSSTTMTGPTISITANDLVYAYFCRTGTPVMTTGSFSPGSGFTLGLTKYQDGCASEFEVSSGGNVTPTMTMGSASTYLVIVAAFKASSGSAGTQPTKPYLARMMSWSSQSNVSASSTIFQLPNSANDLLVITDGGGGTYQGNSVTDSGSNTWTIAGSVNTGGGLGFGQTSEFYVENAGANTTNTQTVNYTGTGDTTVFAYDFVGMPAATYTNRSSYSGNPTTTNLVPASALSFLPQSTSTLTIGTGTIAFDTVDSVSSPSETNFFDAGYFGSMTINGGGSPESVIDQNNIWSHSYGSSIVAAQSWQWGLAANTSQSNGYTADLLNFLTPSGIGIVNTANGNASSGTSVTFTVPSTTAGDMLVVSPAFWDGSTARTVTHVCTGNSSTCGSGTQFTQVTGAASTSNANEFGTDVWYLASAPGSVTQVTMVFSGATTGNDYQYWEVAGGSGSGSWTVDPSGGGGHVSAGSSCSTTCNGASVTTTGTLDVCVAHIESSGSGVTANPKSGNAFIYAGTGGTNFSSGGAANSLLTLTAGAHQPVWSTSSGTFNESTGCFNY